jgi:hypothetical protein
VAATSVEADEWLQILSVLMKCSAWPSMKTAVLPRPSARRDRRAGLLRGIKPARSSVFLMQHRPRHAALEAVHPDGNAVRPARVSLPPTTCATFQHKPRGRRERQSTLQPAPRTRTQPLKRSSRSCRSGRRSTRPRCGCTTRHPLHRPPPPRMKATSKRNLRPLHRPQRLHRQVLRH